MRRSRCIMHRQSTFFICQSGIFFLIEYKKTRKEAIPADFPAFSRVEHTGFEPVTSSMPWRRAPSCANAPNEGIIKYIFGFVTEKLR